MNFIEGEWRAIEQTACANLTNSMARRVTAVLTNDGGHTKYQWRSQSHCFFGGGASWERPRRKPF